jgi:hypothetical protein
MNFEAVIQGRDCAGLEIIWRPLLSEFEDVPGGRDGASLEMQLVVVIE